MARDTYKDKLKEHVKKNLRKGYTPDTLKYAFIRQGYSRVLVEKAIEEAQKELSKEVPILKSEAKYEPPVEEPPVEKKPWWKFW